MENNDIHNTEENKKDLRDDKMDEKIDDNAVVELMKEPKVNLTEPSVKKKLILLGVIVLVVVGGLIYATSRVYKEPVVVEGCKSGDQFSETSGKPCSGEVLTTCQPGELFDRSNGEPCIGVEDQNALPTTGYEAALKAYEGKSVLFDAACAPTPKSLSLSTGAKVLLVNNSKKNMELVAQGIKGSLLPYHFMVSSFSTAGEFPVTCNGKVSSATISVK
ncbi:MAG: hypothetical protein ABIS26_00795 [Candidatus Paceibacterota bacterium]